MPVKGGKLFLPVKAEIRKKIGKKEGDWIKVVLYRDHDPAEIPEELLICLKDEPELYKTFLSYSDAVKKHFTDWIYSAKTDETKVKRIAETLDKVSKGQKFYEQ